MSLEVSFVRHPGQRDHIYVVRDDGTTCDWAFPTYGDQLPHDLCHLVIEDVLQIPNGFWGLVDQGMEVRLIDDQGTLVKDGRPLFEHANFDFRDLIQAEEAVALLAPIGMQVEQVGALAVATRTGAGTVDAIRVGLSRELGFALPAGVSPLDVSPIQTRLVELQTEWRALTDGGLLSISFTRPSGL
jgi:hypothetical protein